MLDFIFALTILLPREHKEKSYCPQINMINIDLGKSIDRGVYKRTRKHCRRLYSKSPCLVKLEQVEKGAFQATCGNRVLLVEDEDKEISVDLDVVEDFASNCSASIFERQPSDLPREVPDPRLGQDMLFCQDLAQSDALLAPAAR